MYYNPGPFTCKRHEGKEENEIMSSLLEGQITGDYYFTTIGKELMQVIRPHLPSLIASREEAPLAIDTLGAPGQNDFQFNLLLKNTEDLSYALALPFYNVEHATISGQMQSGTTQPLQIDAYVRHSSLATTT